MHLTLHPINILRMLWSSVSWRPKPIDTYWPKQTSPSIYKVSSWYSWLLKMGIILYHRSNIVYEMLYYGSFMKYWIWAKKKKKKEKIARVLLFIWLSCTVVDRAVDDQYILSLLSLYQASAGCWIISLICSCTHSYTVYRFYCTYKYHFHQAT